MKKRLSILLAALLLLSGCSTVAPDTTVPPTNVPAELSFSGTMDYAEEEIPYVSRFDTETAIVLSDDGITVNGGEETDTVFTSHDIIYYEDKDAYESGNPYGEGETADKHTAEEADSHMVVNITAPGAYRVSGKLSAGQIRIDLEEDAYDDENAVVELILDGADITCTVAPAILFLNTYECDGDWSTDTAKPDMDTSAAGANLILEGENTVSGSYVAKIYKDKEGEKKLWKQDGAIYSYMSLNVFGPGTLTLNAGNEGLDTELHLTINGGNIAIFSDNDGINTNEDGVSVTTINGGFLHITAGLGAEGDGIDSNGYLVINGGTVISSANPGADAGLDSDLGSYIHGGTVLALGSTMDWAESNSRQVTMNLQFQQNQSSVPIVVTREDGTVVFAYDPGQDPLLDGSRRSFMGAILSCPGLTQGEAVLVFLNGQLSGTHTNGLYTSVSGYDSGVQMQYTGSDLKGGMGGMVPPEGFDGERPEGIGGNMQNGMEPPEGFDGEMPTMPEGMEPGQMPTPPEGETLPAGEIPAFPQGQVPEMPQGGFGGPGDRGQGGQPVGEGSALFFLQDKVNAFSGVASISN